jgi:hypothetical protein
LLVVCTQFETFEDGDEASEDPILNIRGYKLVKYEACELICEKCGTFTATGEHGAGAVLGFGGSY